MSKHCIAWFARCVACLCFWLVLPAGFGTVIGGCAPTHRTPRSALEKPRESTTIGPGDVFKMQIVGEKDLPLELLALLDACYSVFGDKLPAVRAEPVEALAPAICQ